MTKKVLYTAAHSGFNLDEVPLGGAAAICQQLTREWSRTKPFDLELLGPSILGQNAPRQKDLVHYSELAYARFCFAFEKKLTEKILQSDPASTIVLSNDISEGPDFKTLFERGYSIYALYHVDVVDYFCRIYLRGWIRPETATRFYRWLPIPSFIRLLGLVFKKQQDSVLYSKGLIVPSQRMKDVLRRCYPDIPASKIHVLPWGIWESPVSEEEIALEKQAILHEYSIKQGSFVLLMLSRISPEKGQDRLLKALALWEKREDFPKEGVTLLISGEAAYMKGEKFEAELHTLASKLKKCQVYFVGFASPARKKALFSLADLYVFPSRHESYGLTLLEAMMAELPVLTAPSHGAQEVFQPAFGRMISSSDESVVPQLLMEALKDLRFDRSHLKEMGIQAKTWASRQTFSTTAERLAQLILEQ